MFGVEGISGSGASGQIKNIPKNNKGESLPSVPILGGGDSLKVQETEGTTVPSNEVHNSNPEIPTDEVSEQPTKDEDGNDISTANECIGAIGREIKKLTDSIKAYLLSEDGSFKPNFEGIDKTIETMKKLSNLVKKLDKKATVDLSQFTIESLNDTKNLRIQLEQFSSASKTLQETIQEKISALKSELASSNNQLSFSEDKKTVLGESILKLTQLSNLLDMPVDVIAKTKDLHTITKKVMSAPKNAGVGKILSNDVSQISTNFEELLKNKDTLLSSLKMLGIDEDNQKIKQVMKQMQEVGKKNSKYADILKLSLNEMEKANLTPLEALYVILNTNEQYFKALGSSLNLFDFTCEADKETQTKLNNYIFKRINELKTWCDNQDNGLYKEFDSTPEAYDNSKAETLLQQVDSYSIDDFDTFISEISYKAKKDKGSINPSVEFFCQNYLKDNTLNLNDRKLLVNNFIVENKTTLTSVDVAYVLDFVQTNIKNENNVILPSTLISEEMKVALFGSFCEKTELKGIEIEKQSCENEKLPQSLTIDYLKTKQKEENAYELHNFEHSFWEVFNSEANFENITKNVNASHDNFLMSASLAWLYMAPDLRIVDAAGLQTSPGPDFNAMWQYLNKATIEKLKTNSSHPLAQLYIEDGKKANPKLIRQEVVVKVRQFINDNLKTNKYPQDENGPYGHARDVSGEIAELLERNKYNAAESLYILTECQLAYHDLYRDSKYNGAILKSLCSKNWDKKYNCDKTKCKTAFDKIVTPIVLNGATAPTKPEYIKPEKFQYNDQKVNDFTLESCDGSLKDRILNQTSNKSIGNLNTKLDSYVKDKMISPEVVDFVEKFVIGKANQTIKDTDNVTVKRGDYINDWIVDNWSKLNNAELFYIIAKVVIQYSDQVLTKETEDAITNKLFLNDSSRKPSKSNSKSEQDQPPSRSCQPRLVQSKSSESESSSSSSSSSSSGAGTVRTAGSDTTYDSLNCFAHWGGDYLNCRSLSFPFYNFNTFGYGGFSGFMGYGSSWGRYGGSLGRYGGSLGRYGGSLGRYGGSLGRYGSGLGRYDDGWGGFNSFERPNPYNSYQNYGRYLTQKTHPTY